MPLIYKILSQVLHPVGSNNTWRRIICCFVDGKIMQIKQVVFRMRCLSALLVTWSVAIRFSICIECELAICISHYNKLLHSRSEFIHVFVTHVILY